MTIVALAARRCRLDLAAAQERGLFDAALGALDHLLLPVFGAHAGALHVAAVGMRVPRAALAGE